MNEPRAADRIPMDMEVQEHAHLLQFQLLCEGGGHAVVSVSPEQARAFAFSGDVNSMRELNAALQEAWDAGVFAWWYARNVTRLPDFLAAEMEPEVPTTKPGIWERISREAEIEGPGAG